MFRVFSLHVNKWILILLAGDVAAYCLAIVLGTLLLVDPYMPEKSRPLGLSGFIFHSVHAHRADLFGGLLYCRPL